MNRVQARQIGDAVEAAVKEAIKGMGVAYVGRRGTFGLNDLNIKLEFADVKGGEVQSRAVTDFKRLCSRYGLEPDDLGREFVSGGVIYTIVGLNTRAPKYPIKCTRQYDGRGFKFTEAQIRFALERV